MSGLWDSHKHKVQSKLQKTVEMDGTSFKLSRKLYPMPGNDKNSETLKTRKVHGMETVIISGQHTKSHLSKPEVA